VTLHTNDPVEMYLREVASSQPLSTAEELTLCQEAKSPDETRAELAKRRLIESRLPLVVTIAERHSSAGIPMLDLIQEGNIGLLVALNTFAESSTSDFSVHAAVCIEDAILKAIAESQSK
jgi:DNA-directed RNA polymerase sigma subunit (sigma70/sigma32)